MGPDNMMVEFIQNAYGVDVTDRKAVAKLSDAQKHQFVQMVAALSSNVFRESAGTSRALTPAGTLIGETAGKAVEGVLGIPEKVNNWFGRKREELRATD